LLQPRPLRRSIVHHPANMDAIGVELLLGNESSNNDV
jgi:hypothetical protein